MHAFDSNSSTVPAFLVKLWKLVEDPSCDDLIAWSDSGDRFIIKDQAKFAKDLLPQYFKHNNMASFIRQLNMYGFKKINDFEKSGLRFENNDVKFAHGFFMKGRSELLEYIKRKISNAKVSETPPKSNAKDILVDLTSIREKQENMDNMLLKMKQENELLWRELTSMRQKHKAQEQIIQKVIQFLVSIVQRSGNQNIGVGVQRKIARMIHGSPSSKASTSNSSRTIDVLRKKNSDCIIVPEQMVSPLGPVIHEVTDCDHEEAQNAVPSFIVKSPESSVSSPCINPSDNLVSVLLPKSPGEKESSDSRGSKSPLVSLLNSHYPVNSPKESLGILKTLAPKPQAAVSEKSNCESILGIPSEYITVPENDVAANVISISNDGSVISRPDDEAICNVISIPEGTDIIPYSSLLNNIIAIPSNGTENKDSSSTNNAASSGIFNASCVGVFGDSSTQDLLAYSPLEKNDFDNQMSESLQTPKILTSDDDGCGFSSKDNDVKENASKKSDANKFSFTKINTHNEHDYLATTNTATTIAKNVLSNHLLAVDEKLNYAQDQLATNYSNVEIQTLLGLFSNDDELMTYDSFTNNIAADLHLKSGNDIVGNEIVQFTPNMLDVEMDIANSPLFESLVQDAEVPSSDFDYQTDGTSLEDVLSETAASDVADYLNETAVNSSPVKCRKRPTKVASRKRRKTK